MANAFNALWFSSSWKPTSSSYETQITFIRKKYLSEMSKEITKKLQIYSFETCKDVRCKNQLWIWLLLFMIFTVLYHVCGLFSVNFEKSLYLCLFRLKAWQNWSKACVNLENFQTKSNNKLERFSSTYFLIFVGKAGASFKGDHSIRQGLKVLQGQTL